jgi:mRNA interferase HigB
MKVLGRDKLNTFSQQHANAKKALDAWFNEAEEADWKKPQDIKDQSRGQGC